MLKNEPRPEIEHHYHIEQLIEKQQKRADDRTRQRNIEKMREENASEVADGPAVEPKSFWCRHCRVDFVGVAFKHVEVDWNDADMKIAYYTSKHHACGRPVIRLVTDRFRDRYWFDSKAVAMDRGKHYKDLLQPFENGYNLLYGKK